MRGIAVSAFRHIDEDLLMLNLIKKLKAVFNLLMLNLIKKLKAVFKMSTTMTTTTATIRAQIADNPVLLYMKGSPEHPQCGFSAQSSQILMACGERFAFIDILTHPDIRATLPEISEWPTFPQLFLAGELVGGCDIITEEYESGELEPKVKQAVASQAT